MNTPRSRIMILFFSVKEEENFIWVREGVMGSVYWQWREGG